MNRAERFALWLSKPSNCDKVLWWTIGLVVFGFLLGTDYSPIEILRAKGGL